MIGEASRAGALYVGDWRQLWGQKLGAASLQTLLLSKYACGLSSFSGCHSMEFICWPAPSAALGSGPVPVVPTIFLMVLSESDC